MTQPEYKPGDVVNGHRLGDDNVWRPVEQGAPTAHPANKPGDVVNGHRLGEDNVWRPVAGNAPTGAPAGPYGGAPAAPPYGGRQPLPAKDGGGALGWVRSHKVISGVAAGVLLIGFIGAATSGGDDSTSISTVADTASPSSSSTPTPSETFTMPSDAEIAAVLDSVWVGADDTPVGDLYDELEAEFGGTADDYREAVNAYRVEKRAEEEKAAAEAEAKAAAKEKAAINNAKAPSERQWAKIVKDPDSYIGKYYVVYGEITQFDSATGTDTFRADVAHKNVTEYGFFIGDNCLLTGSEKRLSDFVRGDVFKATVMVMGPLSYDTQIGGNTTVPLLDIAKIVRVGHNS